MVVAGQACSGNPPCRLEDALSFPEYSDADSEAEIVTARTWHEGCSCAERRKYIMNRTTLAAVLALTTLAAASPAQAGVRIGIEIDRDRRGGYGYEGRGRYNVDRIAFDNGYRDGLREGEKDDRHDDRYNFRDEGRWRDGDSGYRREYGPRYEYVSNYRRGFEEGYRQGYSNRRSYRRDDGWNNRRYERR